MKQKTQLDFKDILDSYLLNLAVREEAVEKHEDKKRELQNFKEIANRVLENEGVIEVVNNKYLNLPNTIQEVDKLLLRLDKTFRSTLEEAIITIERKIKTRGETAKSTTAQEEIKQARGTIARFRELLENEVAMKLGEEKFLEIQDVTSKTAAEIARKLTLDKELPNLKEFGDLKEFYRERSDLYYRAFYNSIDGNKTKLNRLFKENTNYLGENNSCSIVNAVKEVSAVYYDDISSALKKKLAVVRGAIKETAKEKIPKWICGSVQEKTEKIIDQLGDTKLKSFLQNPKKEANPTDKKVREIIAGEELLLESIFHNFIKNSDKDSFPKNKEDITQAFLDNKEEIKKAFISAEDSKSFADQCLVILPEVIVVNNETWRTTDYNQSANLNKESIGGVAGQQIEVAGQQIEVAGQQIKASGEQIKASGEQIKVSKERIGQIAEILFPSSFIGHNKEYSIFRLKNLFKYEDNKESSKKTLEDFIKGLNESSDKTKILSNLMKFVNKEDRKSGRDAITEEEMNNSLALINQNYFGGFCSGETGDVRLQKAIKGSVLYATLNDDPSPKITDPNEFLLFPDKSQAIGS